MQYFLGIVPPEEYKNKIIKFQQKWENNRIGDSVEPHLTLKAQGGLTPDKEWISKIKCVCKSFTPFNISVSKTMFFGDDILYCSAHRVELFKIHNSIVQEVSPSDDLIRKYFELDDFTPHITLGKTFYGVSKQELKEMEELAKEELSPYPTLEVKFIRIYQEIEPGRYIPYSDIPLKQELEV